MRRHRIRSPGGGLLAVMLALALASGAAAQSRSPFSLNFTPPIDSVAHEAEQRNAAAVAQLLAGGHDPNEVEKGRSALAIATIDDDPQIVAMLIKAGARLNDKDDAGDTPLHHAAELNFLDLVQLLLDAGAAVDPQNRDGMTPLMLAASRGHVAIARVLLEKGASLAKTDYTGRDALEWAQDSRQTAIVQLLRQAAARR